MPDQLALSRPELDALIADVARRTLQILPVLRRVKDGAIGYLELTRNGARILRLGAAGRLPMVALVADPEGRGPVDFRPGFLRYALSQAGAVVIVCDDQDDLPYEIAASHAAEGRKHVVLVECPRAAIGEWSEFAYAHGIEPGNLTAFISEPSLPDGLAPVKPDELPPAKPGGPVH